MKHKLWLMGVFLVLSAVWGSAVQPVQAQGKVSALVWQDLAQEEQVAVLVLLAQQAPVTRMGRQSAQAVYGQLASVAQTTQPAVTARLQRLGVPYRSFTLVNALALRADRALVLELAARPDVAAVVSDRAFAVTLEEPQASGPLACPSGGTEWNVSWVGADAVWNQGTTGSGVVVANADTGIAWEHVALKSSYRGWDGNTANHAYNWWDAIHEDLPPTGSNVCGLDSAVPCDDYGHGTHTLGTAVGAQGVGLAPGATWIACRNMENGVGRPSTYLECLDFFLAPWDAAHQNPNPALHADVISNSYGCPSSELCDVHTFDLAVANLRAAGIFFSVSAGNAGSACSTVSDPPGLVDAAITVGATQKNSNEIASLSSRGPVTVDGSNRRKPDLVAPGLSVCSTSRSGGYVTMSGTSMAAPHVAGAVALLWARFPGLRGDVDATEALLEASATARTSSQCGDAPDAVPNNVYGYGVLNVWAAYQQALPPCTVHLETPQGQTVTEGQTLTLQVQLGGEEACGLSPHSVAFETVDGSAVAGQDYAALSGNLSWSAEDGSARSLALLTYADAWFELPQTLQVQLHTPGQLQLGEPSQRTITIVNLPGALALPFLMR